MAESFSHIESGTSDDSTELFLRRGNIPHVDLPGKLALGNTCKIKLNLSGQGLTDLPKNLPISCELEELNLSNNSLSHDISFVQYLRFPRLKKLDLSSCGFTELPKNLSYFSELEELNLSNNPLSHEISSLECVRFPGLKKFDLSGCGLTELPKNLPYCHKLEELNLSNNPLNRYMSFFEHVRLSELKKLHLSGCGLTELPNDIHSFYELEELNVSNNPLSHDITFFQNVRSSGLKKLNLSGCGLTKLPNGLGGFRGTLNLANNLLGLYIEYGSFAHELKSLDLSGCGLTGLPNDIYNCFELDELNLSSNPLGHLHMSFSDYVPLYRLKKLDLSGCAFTRLPLDFRNFFELEELNLSNNPLRNLDISFYKCIPWDLKRLDLSSCRITKLPNDLEKCDNLHELNFSNNSFDHRDLLEKLNNRKMFSYSECYQSSKELLESTASGLELSKPTCRIIFEDVVYIRSGGVWAVEHKDVASTRYVSSTNEKDQGQIRNKEIWLREFCHIRKSEKLTIETYYAMLQSLNLVCDLVNTILSGSHLKRQSTLSLNRFTGEILYFLSIVSRRSVYRYANKCISNLKSAVSGLRNLFIHSDDDTCKLKGRVKEFEMAFKETCEALFSAEKGSSNVVTILMRFISVILSNITKPEAAVLPCLQSLQELADLGEKEITKTRYPNRHDFWDERDVAEFVLNINKILFEFVGMFLKPPPTVEDWPATIQHHGEIFNPLIDGCWGIKSSFVVNKVKGPVADAIEYSVPFIGETVDNSITVDRTGGCFSLPEVNAFLLFPPDAVEHKITLQSSRVKFKECVKPRDGEAFVSRILKVEPAGVIFNKPVTVLLSHSLDEKAFLYFYELIVENLSPTGWQELKTERIRFFEDIPKEISNKKILENHLPFAKAIIRETCTLVAATRATFNQILIPTNRPFFFSKQYGDSAELKITFPAGVTEKIMILNFQLFPADAVLNKEMRLNKSIVYAPIIRVSGQTTPFLKAVDVELTYSHSDVLNIDDNFLPVGKNIQFTTEYGLLMQTNNETGSKDNWDALNESDGVLLKRLRKDQLKFSFSVKHFSDVHIVVKSEPVSSVPQVSASVMDVNNPACHCAIVFAVHKTGATPKTLHAVLAPSNARDRLSTKWNVEGMDIQSRYKCDEPVYFCVPMPGVAESGHLFLEDHTLRFDPEKESELRNDTDEGVDLAGKKMRFLKDRECNNGENHTTQGDCRAIVPIHISSAESRKLILTDEPPQERCDVSSGAENAQMNNNQASEIMLHRCGLFERTVETAAQTKMVINKAFAEDPTGSKATKMVGVVGPTTTVIASLACGITAAMSIPTFGAASFAAALVAGGTFLVKVVDKRCQQANAKKIEEVLITAVEEAKISSYLNCVVKDVARELSRIFESQLFELEKDEQVKILAECAVELMFDLHNGDKFNRNTLLRKVLQDGKIKKKKIPTRTNGILWSVPNVFRKPGLRRIIFGKDVVEFKHFIKRKAGKKGKYGYRGQFLEAKTCASLNGEEQTAATDETLAIENACKECCFIDEICTSGLYFDESDIDACYSKHQPSTYSYIPLHILIQCPKFLEFFNQLHDEKPSLVDFLKSKCHLPEDHLVRPVYRPHSPRKVSNLQNSDLTGSDFSHCDFTNSSLMKSNFTKCVMLFVNLEGAKMSGSKFCDTLISHSNLEKLEADHCEWTKTSLLYSNVKGADLSSVIPSPGGNYFDGTSISEAITGNNRELNSNEELVQVRIVDSQICRETSNSATADDHHEGTSGIQSNMSDDLETGEPNTNGDCSNETNEYGACMLL